MTGQEELRPGWQSATAAERYPADSPGFEENLTAHAAAMVDDQPGYIDRRTGLFVMTAAFLAGRPCCDNRCRHCPWTP